MDVDRARAADHVEDDGAPEQPPEPRATVGSNHHLRDPLGPRQVQDRLRNPRSHDLLEPATDLPHQLADRLEVRRVIPAPTRDDVNGDQVTAASRGHPRGAANDGLVLRTTPHRD